MNPSVKIYLLANTTMQSQQKAT